MTKIDPIKWKMQPLCFYGPPGQITGPSKITAPGFYPGLLPGPSNPEPGPSSRSSSSQSNYVQVQVQLMPRLNYASNPAQVQPTVSLTGPGVPNLSLTGQQPSVSFTKPGVPTFSPTGQQSADTSHRVPYYCTSVPIPIISQPERSSTVKQDSPIHSVKSNWTADSLHKPGKRSLLNPEASERALTFLKNAFSKALESRYEVFREDREVKLIVSYIRFIWFQRTPTRVHRIRGRATATVIASRM